MSEEISFKPNVKDSVFTHLFQDKQYTLQLFQALHPEAKDVTEDMIELVTLENVLVGNNYNDLGFKVGNQIVILVEAQSTWTVNIIVRVMMYYLYTLKKYIADNKLYLYGGSAVPLPAPEFYVIYTGDRHIDKDVINFSDEFFGGKSVAIQAWVRVLTAGKRGDIIYQYVTFAKVLDGQVKLYGKTIKAITETIRICKDMDVLKEYLTQHEQEVQDIMITLFDNETIMDAFAKAKIEEGREEGRTEGENSKAIKIARKMLQAGYAPDAIVNMTDLPLTEVNALKAQMAY